MVDAGKRREVSAWIQSALLPHAGKEAFAQLVGMITDLRSAVPLTLGLAPTPAALQQQEQLTFLVRCITSVSGQLNELRHEALLKALYSISLWLAPPELRAALLELVEHLVVVKAAFLQPCVDHIVKAFAPPFLLLPHLASPPKATWVPPALVLEVHQSLTATCSHILTKVPRSAPLLRKAVSEKMPHKLQTRDALCIYLHAVLSLAEADAGAVIRDSLLLDVITLLVSIDVDIRWEDIVDQLTGQEEEEGSSDEEDDIFGMEDNVRSLHIGNGQTAEARPSKAPLDGWEGMARSPPATTSMPQSALGADGAAGVQKSLEMADKLDVLMALVFRHLRSRAEGGQAPRVWETVRGAFQHTILLTHRAKFTPFLVYLAATLPRGGAGAKDFLELLVSRILDPAQPLVIRTTCAAYCASFLARAAYVPSPVLMAALNALADFALQYSDVYGGKVGGSSKAPLRAHNACRRASLGAPGGGGGGAKPPAAVAPRASCDGAEARRASVASTSGAGQEWAPPEGWQKHEVYYAAVQVIVYSLCYHMVSVEKGDDAEPSPMKAFIQHKVLRVLDSCLRPLHVCLPTAVAEFAKQLSLYNLGSISHALPPFISSADPTALPRAHRPLEMFFPFDPYLLPLSAPQLDLNRTYRVWRHGHVVSVRPKGGGQAPADDGNSDSDDDDDDDAEASESESDSDDSVGRSPRASISISPAGASPQFVPATNGNPFLPRPSSGALAVPGAHHPAKSALPGCFRPGSDAAAFGGSHGAFSDAFSGSPGHGHSVSPGGMSPMGMSPIGAYHPSLLGGSPGGGGMMSCTPDVRPANAWAAHI